MKRQLVILISMLCVFSGPACCQSSECWNKDCNTDMHFISETPRGVVDGWNSTLLLTRQPAQTSAVHAFRNGIELKYPQDFSIEGEAITFAPSEVPIPGDVIRAIYPASRTNADVLLGLSTPSTGRQPVRSQDEVTMQAARQALADESKRFDEALGKRHQLLRGPPLPGQGYGTGARPAALGMLDERLRELRVQGRNSRKGNPQSNGDLDGVEGAGDEPLLSPFGRNIDESRGAEWNSSGSDGKSARDASGMPSSAGIRMLERRLNQEGEIDQDTGDKKSKPNKKSALMDILR